MSLIQTDLFHFELDCPIVYNTQHVLCNSVHSLNSLLKCQCLVNVACVCVCVCVCVSRSVVFDSLRPHGLWPARLLCPWNSPGKNTGVGCHSFLQGIFLTQGLNPGILHCRQILYHLSYQGHMQM